MGLKGRAIPNNTRNVWKSLNISPGIYMGKSQWGTSYWLGKLIWCYFFLDRLSLWIGAIFCGVLLAFGCKLHPTHWITLNNPQNRWFSPPPPWIGGPNQETGLFAVNSIEEVCKVLQEKGVRRTKFLIYSSPRTDWNGRDKLQLFTSAHKPQWSLHICEELQRW